jgi:hypothetical protein
VITPFTNILRVETPLLAMSRMEESRTKLA